MGKHGTVVSAFHRWTNPVILFTGLNDWVLRNLLCSSFAPAARDLGLQLHGMVYPESYPVYRDILTDELRMGSEPQHLVRQSDFKQARLDRLAFRSALYRRGRVNSQTFRATRRQSWHEQGNNPLERLKLEASFIAGRIGGTFGWERSPTNQYLGIIEQTEYVRNVCIPKLRELNPRILVSTSPETPYDLPWLIAAGRLGIARSVLIRSWDNISSKCTILPDAEMFLVWSKLMEDELRFHFPEYARRKVVKIGAPQFDGHTDLSNIIPREEFCSRLGLDSKKAIVLYCTGGPHICRNEHLLIKELQDTIQQLSTKVQLQLLVRLHPYFWNTDLRVYEEIRGAAIWPKQEDVPQMLGGSTTGLLDDYRMMLSSFYHQAVNVNVASTVTLDSMIFDRPVINIKYDGPQRLPRSIRVKRVYKYDHYRNITASGAVQLVGNKKALESALLRAIQEPGRRSAARREIVELECGPVDGNAGKRLAEALSQISGATKRQPGALKPLVAAV